MNSPLPTPPIPAQRLTRKDYSSGAMVRWCPGCGDYSVLANVQRALENLQIPKENLAIVSGIGCSSRFPYYMGTYGFHTIHGRAPAIATGVKLANPELSVWVVTGDGDGLSIGGNHLLHLMRKNVDVNVLLFNNRIYGLTKGQLSPTSEFGKVTKSTPQGGADHPINPAAFALGANCSFFARAIDVDATHMVPLLERCEGHRGTSLLEIFQNCVVFNDGAFDGFVGKGKEDQQLWLEHGQPMRFGANGQFGLRLNSKRLTIERVELGVDGITEADLLVHDETNEVLAGMLARLPFPEFPAVLGVLYAQPRTTHGEALAANIEQARSQKAPEPWYDVLLGKASWKVTSAKTG